MANAIFGHANAVLSGTVTAGSEVVGLTAGNLQNPHGSDAAAWRTAGAMTPDDGAWFTVNAGASAPWRAFLLAGTNLSPSAQVRWRVGGAAAIFPEVPLFAADFTGPTPVMPADAVFSRLSTALYFGSDGTLIEAAAGVPRIAYDPVTRALQGLLVEPSSLNGIRNPRAEFASAPTLPTTQAPTHWAHSGFNGLTSTIVGRGEESGIPYVDVRFNGLAAGATGFIWLDTATGIGAANGDIWTFSVFARLVAVVSGSITATTLQLSEVNGALAVVATQSGAATLSQAGLTSQRHALTATLTGAGTATVRPTVAFNVANGATDFTVRIGLPQAEKLRFPSSPIMPPVGVVAPSARAGDELSWPLPTTYDAATGTLFAEQMTGAVPALSTTGAWFRLDDGTTAHRAELRTGSNAAGAAYVSVGIVRANSTQLSGGINFASLGTVQRQSLAWALNDGVGYYNGTQQINDSVLMPPIVTRLWLGATNAVVFYRKIALYTPRLTNGQAQQLSINGTTLDAGSLAYDSGTIAAGVVPSIGQSFHAAPAEVVGQYARCDLTDPGNPDGFLSVALAYLGPVWQPAVNVSPETALAANRGQDAVRSRAGASFISPRFYERGWSVAHDAVAGADLWTQLMPLDRAAAAGENILFVPDPASPNANREAVFGPLETTAAIGFRTPTGDFRSWRARIVERL